MACCRARAASKTAAFNGARLNEVAMRMLLRIILVVTTILAVAPATAQRYDHRYPVCFQKWGEGGFTAIDCSYTSAGTIASGIVCPALDQGGPNEQCRRDASRCPCCRG
jgi:hypothetical protein